MHKQFATPAKLRWFMVNSQLPPGRQIEPGEERMAGT
jgi:hypothetical protein